MKVLHLLYSDRFSGAENVVCQIIAMFSDSNVDMVYCSCDGQIRDALEERKIKYVPIKNLSVSEVKRVIVEEQPDLIHAHDMRASFIGALACGKIPLVSHIHNNSFDSRGLSVKSIAYSLAAFKSKQIVWVSQSAFEGYFFHGLFKDKSKILYNIIDIDELYRKKDVDQNQYDYDLIYLGRLTFPKNPQRMVGVIQKIKELKPDVRAVVVGSGDLDEEIKQMVNKMNLSKNIDLLGFVSNPYRILYSSKVMLMTSRWEGTPMCSLEALALGVPIVSTPVDGLKDIIDYGTNGFLEDDDNALAKRIVEIVCNNSFRKELSDNAYSFSLSYNDKIAYKKVLMDIYEGAILH